MGPIPPPCLDSTRQKYLYDKIRDFCLREESRDIVCAKPIVPSNDMNGSSSSEEAAQEAPVPRKKKDHRAKCLTRPPCSHGLNNVLFSPGKLTLTFEDCVSYTVYYLLVLCLAVDGRLVVRARWAVRTAMAINTVSASRVWVLE